MAGHAITVSGTIPAARDRVWQVLTDIDNASTLIPSIKAVERLTEGPYAVGSRWRETRTMLGRTETHELEVAEAAQPERTVVTAFTDGVQYTTTMQLDDDPVGTRLTMTFGAHQPDATPAQRVLWKVMGPIGSVFTRRVLNKELQEIREAATRV